MDFVVLDVETANKNHAICQFGAVLVKDGAIVDRFESLVNPLVPFGAGYIKFHKNENTGITEETVKDAPIFPHLLNILPQWVFQYPIVAHNAQTEFFALAKAFLLYHKQMPSLSFYCTMKTAEKVKGMPKKLGEIANHLHIRCERAHTALCDAETTAQVALHFLSRGYLLERFIPQTTPSLIDTEWEKFQPIKGSQFFLDPRLMWIKPGTRAAESYLMHNDWPELKTFNTNRYRIPDCNFWQGEIAFQDSVFVLSGCFPPYIPDVLYAEIAMRGGICTDKLSTNADYVVVGAADLEKVKNSDWKSTKILQAEEKIRQGAPIKLLQGKKFLELLGR